MGCMFCIVRQRYQCRTVIMIRSWMCFEMWKNRACRVVPSMAKIQGWNSEASQCEANAAYIVLSYSASPGRCQCCAALKVTALRLP